MLSEAKEFGVQEVFHGVIFDVIFSHWRQKGCGEWNDNYAKLAKVVSDGTKLLQDDFG